MIPRLVSAKVAGSLGAEAWYANWRVEGGLDSLGIEVEYAIDPTVIFGCSASFAYERDGTVLTGILVDYFTAKMDGDVAGETGGGQTYALVRGGPRTASGSMSIGSIRIRTPDFEPSWCSLDPSFSPFVERPHCEADLGPPGTNAERMANAPGQGGTGA